MSDITTASSLQVDYITLLTTQLQNQNPLDPMDNSEMTTQLAQISQLAQMETLNKSFAEVLERTEQGYANSLLGTDVMFLSPASNGEMMLLTGNVDQVLNSNGEIYLGVGDYSLTLDDIIGISAAQESTEDANETS